MPQCLAGTPPRQRNARIARIGKRDLQPVTSRGHQHLFFTARFGSIGCMIKGIISGDMASKLSLLFLSTQFCRCSRMAGRGRDPAKEQILLSDMRRDGIYDRSGGAKLHVGMPPPMSASGPRRSR